MTDNVLALSSAAMVATQAAVEQFMLAAAAPSGRGYRLLIVAQLGCGGYHDYRNLQRAEAMGIKVEYVNINNPGKRFVDKDRDGKLVAAPGEPVPFVDDRYDAYLRNALDRNDYLQGKAFNYLRSKRLEFYDATKAVLLDANGTVVHKFESTKGQNFLNELQSYMQPSRSPARGAQRS